MQGVLMGERDRAPVTVPGEAPRRSGRCWRDSIESLQSDSRRVNLLASLAGRGRP